MSEAGGPRGAVFLDRDGVVNRRLVGAYVRSPAELEPLPGSLDAIARLSHDGLPVVIVTNQSGIGRALMTEADLARVHEHLERLLGERAARVDAIYHCPHHPDAGCRCRKPGTEMLERAAREHGLDLRRSFLVGDSPTDIAAGAAAGLTTLLATGDRHGPYPPDAPRPTHVVHDLAEAAEWILSRR